jgi:hypothetical protein
MVARNQGQETGGRQLSIDQGKSSKLEKVNKGLYVEHWKEGERPFNWFKHPEYLWMTLHHIKLSAGVAGPGGDSQERLFSRSMIAIGEFERRRDIEVWRPEAGPSRFSSAKVSLRTQPDRSPESELLPGVLIHMVGTALKYGFEEEEPHLQFDLCLPKTLMDQLWAEASTAQVAKATLAVRVEVFQSEVERSLAEPWHHQTYCIENDSANTATFNSLWFEKSAAISESLPADPVANDEGAKGLRGRGACREHAVAGVGDDCDRAR